MATIGVIFFILFVCLLGFGILAVTKYFENTPGNIEPPTEYTGRNKHFKRKPVKLTSEQIEHRLKNGGVSLGFSKEYPGQQITQDVETRKANTLFIGPNGVGKTNHILSTAIRQDIFNPNVSPVIFDGKNSRHLVGAIEHFCAEAGRELVIFPDCGGYNPLGIGRSARERGNTFGNMLSLAKPNSDDYFLSQQNSLLTNIVPLFEKANGGRKMIPQELRNLINSERYRKSLLDKAKGSREAKEFDAAFESYRKQDFVEKLSGMNAFIDTFSIYGSVVGRAHLYNQRETDNLHKAIERKAVIVVREGGAKGTQEQALGMVYLAEIMKYAKERTSSHLVALYLDELHFYVSAPYAQFLATSREKNFAQYIGFQSFGQLKAVSDDVAQSIMTNCRTWIVHNGLSYDDAAIVSKEAGDREYIVYTESSKVGEPFDGVTQGRRLEYRSLFTTTEVQNIPPGQLLYLTIDNRQPEPPQLIIKPERFDEKRFTYIPPEFPDEIPLTVWEEEAEEAFENNKAEPPFTSPDNEKTSQGQKSVKAQKTQVNSSQRGGSRPNMPVETRSKKEGGAAQNSQKAQKNRSNAKSESNIIQFDDI